MRVLGAALITALSMTAFASDHIDGPVTQKHRVADLSDFFAFPTPNKPGSLTLILNTYPIAPSKAHFTDKATYAILLRRAEVAGVKEQARFSTSDEVVINCTFATPYEHDDHVVRCTTTNGMAAQASHGYRGKVGWSKGDFRLHSGMHSDPFFFYASFAKSAAEKGELKAPKNDNVMSLINCLSIVIEIDINKVFPGVQPNLIAAATAVVTRDAPSAQLRILDRLGRPEVTNVTMFTPKGATELRDHYNVERPFSPKPAMQSRFEARVLENITHYDALDKKTDWTAADKATFARVFTDDFLVIDPSKPCSGDNFLEIEKSMIQGKPHMTCGGRKLTDDIMDTLFTTYIAGLNGARIRDGVDTPEKKVSNQFPYLANPDVGVKARIKAGIARIALFGI